MSDTGMTMIWILQSTPATRRWALALRAGLLIQIIFTLSVVCLAHSETNPATSKPAEDKPLASDERAELLKLIRSLQERVDKLEAAQAAQAANPQQAPSTQLAPPAETKYDPSTSDDPHVWMPP